eukprot:scpid103596/ scgid1372/ 
MAARQQTHGGTYCQCPAPGQTHGGTGVVGPVDAAASKLAWIWVAGQSLYWIYNNCYKPVNSFYEMCKDLSGAWMRFKKMWTEKMEKKKTEATEKEKKEPGVVERKEPILFNRSNFVANPVYHRNDLLFEEPIEQIRRQRIRASFGLH